ncbi:diguanylate cyclase (GGDEF)-like protein [Rhodococcus fascians]|nr:diguanylate cyclase (GGDEF)-like protein [Rhodococcus sp. 3258]MDR6933077.1 diguanylate cyclase (GGDEF)-like protein [Rhodococcus fascians]
MTDVVEAERALERAALQDPLTGLPNRMKLLERIGSAIERGARTGAAAAVLFCDLDGFKRINDTGGHAAGDAVLVEVARRLRSVLRAEDSIARVGGDEFVLVLDALPAENGTGKPAGGALAAQVAERIRTVLAAPIAYGGREYVVSASVGMVLVRRGVSAQEALRDADSAMYRAKQLGKDRIELFDDALRVHAIERAYIEQTLRDALDPDRGGSATFGVAYQPVYDLGSRRLVSSRRSLACGTARAQRFHPTDSSRWPRTRGSFPIWVSACSTTLSAPSRGGNPRTRLPPRPTSPSRWP